MHLVVLRCDVKNFFRTFTILSFSRRIYNVLETSTSPIVNNMQIKDVTKARASSLRSRRAFAIETERSMAGYLQADTDISSAQYDRLLDSDGVLRIIDCTSLMALSDWEVWDDSDDEDEELI